MLRSSGEPAHRLIQRFRLPIVAAMVVFANAHHMLTRGADLQWRLTSMVVVYGVAWPIAAWFVLGWLGRLSRRADEATDSRLAAMEDLQRRNQQVQALYEASRFLAGASHVEHVLEPVLASAARAAEAEGAVLLWRAGDDDQPRRIVIGTVPTDAAADHPACALCPSSLPCPVPTEISCLPLRSGVTHLGYIRLYGGRQDSVTQRGLAALASELEFTWAARNAERRALAALQQREAPDHATTKPHAALAHFLEAIGRAMEAEGAAYARRASGTTTEIARWGSVGNEPWPDPVGDAVVQSGNARTMHVAAGTGGVLRLNFVAPKAIAAFDTRFLAPLSAQAALLADLDQREAEAVWRERGRLAGELHDGLAQTLAYLHLQLAQAPNLAVHDDPAASRERLSELAEETLGAYAGLRDMIDDLRLLPRTDESAGAFLTRAARAAGQRAGMRAEVDLPEELDLTPLATAQLARAIQEAIVNAISHGMAEHVRVHGTLSAGKLRVEVEDNGIGFDPQAVPPADRHGIAIMQDRIASLGGNVALRSAHATGTTVAIELPTGEPRPEPHPG